MKKLLILTLCLAGWGAFAQKARIVKVEDVVKVINAPGDRIQVINFWATWCGPCVKEMPLLEALNRDRKDVQVTLVSLDMDLDPDPAKVHKFVERKKLQSTVLILDESDPNSYIDRIASEWSGALPATLIVNPATGKRKFVEKELHEGDLERLIDEVN